MRRTTALMSGFKAETQSGEELNFELCKGGYFSDKEEYGLKVVGKTEQKTLSGKNLFDIAAFIEKYNAAKAHDFAAELTTYDGVECISYTTHCYNLRFMQGQFTDNMPYTFTMSIYCDTVNDAAEIMRIIYTDGNTQAINIPTNQWNNVTITTGVNKTIDYITVANYSVNAKCYIVANTLQLEKGSTATEYEPYCGGIPSPNPDYPQEIQYVKAGTKIKCCGEVVTPCDLYEGDIWFPMSGKVEKHTKSTTISNITTYIPNKNDEYFYVSVSDGTISGCLFKTKIWSDMYIGNNTTWYKKNGYYIQPNLNTPTSMGCYLSIRYDDLGEGYDKNTDDTTLYKEGKKFINNKNIKIIYQLKTPTIEQYAPQPIFAPQGTVNVLQEPVDLSADLSATMLVHR